MNTQTNRVGERVWMFLHGELDASRRADFERALAVDPELRRQVEGAGRLDRALRAVLPTLGEVRSADDRLAERAQVAWQRDQPRETLEAFCQGQAVSPRAKWRRMFRPAVTGFIGVAAAAALVMVFSPAAREPQGVRWGKPEFSPLALRGSRVPAEWHKVDSGTVQRCHEALMTAVSACAAERGLSFPAGLKFSFHVRELRNGSFSVAVEARFRDGRMAGEWYGDYSGAETFLTQVGVSAQRMVEAVATPSCAESEGVRP